jgi:hypothetical protein
VLIHIKKILHAERSPIVVVGGSYSGSKRNQNHCGCTAVFKKSKSFILCQKL